MDVDEQTVDRTAARSAPGERPLRVLHLVIVLGETNGQYNEHCLPLIGLRDLTICSYFKPKLVPPDGIAVFGGDDSLLGFFRALGRALDAKDYDIIHAHAPHTGTLLALALLARPRRWRLRRKLVYTVQDSYHDYKLRNKLLMLPALATFRRVVFCGHAARASYPALWRRLVGGRSRVVQNAADLDRVDKALDGAAPTRDDATFDVVSVGRLERVKDPFVLLSAFDRVDSGDSRLVFVGAGSLDSSLRDQISAGGLGDRVEMTGLIPRDEVFVRCARADLFVSASLGEGLPVAVIEAMACGCPVVLSDIPPHREVAEGVDFIPFVRTGDADGFAREIERFRRMPVEERAAIGRECRKLARARFGLDVMHAGIDKVYRELT